MPDATMPPVGVVLLQLGGPDTLAAVEPFLYNLFCDPDIIDLPLAFLVRRPLARLIARSRGPKVQEYYRRIGGRSPILKLTRRQASALERALAPRVRVKAVIAMRYWHPMTDAAIDELVAAGVRRVVLLPLYPHYSRTTTGSSVNEWRRRVAARGVPHLAGEEIGEYCEHPAYIGALIRNIGIALRRVPEGDRAKVQLVFSAHGTPVKLVREGDPYRSQIIRTYDAVIRAGKFGLRHHLCYQSKVGPQEWLAPSLDATLERLAAEKATHLLVVPIAFVSDHSETLWEINIEAKAEAKRMGIIHYDMSPALNTNPLFIEALADLVARTVAP
jgi:ferrochelatase